MNKAEIIRKISKKAGVPDTEAKKFFELFLKNASDLLKPGESLEVTGVGKFQLRVGQIEKRSSQNAGQEYIYSDLIVYINKDENSTEEDEIIFNVPSGVEREFQPIDSHFSLSIGKPVIPLKGIKETEFFIPASGTELRSLLESKVEKLITEAKKVTGGKETETIRLSDGSSTESQADWKKMGIGNDQTETELPTRSDFLKTREFENLSWDFGENLSEEIEEESILDLDSEEEGEISETEKDASESGVTSKEATPPGTAQKRSTESEVIKPEFEEETRAEKKEDYIFEDIIDENADEAVDYEEELEEEESPFTIFEEDSVDAEEEIKEKVDKITAEFDETPEEEGEHDEFGMDDSEPDGSFDRKDLNEEKPEETEEVMPDEQEPVLKNFQRVKSLTREFTTTAFDDTEEKETEKPKRITEVRGGYQKVRRTTAEFNFDLSGIKGLDEIEDEPPAGERHTHSYRGYNKRSRIPSLIIALVVVIVLAAIFFLYFKLKSANNESMSTASEKDKTTIIERNDDVPVTYPYDNQSEYTGRKDGTPDEKQGKTDAGLQSSGNSTTFKNDIAEITEPVNAQRIGNYIYQYPDGVVVQVSSWKSKTIALNQVQKYRDAGYTAFAEKAEISGMGLYYRVRVGYFGSLEEAEKFINGNH